MSKILLVTSSPRGAASHSTRIATELAEKLKAATPGSTIKTHNLVANPLPHIVPEFTSGIYTPAENRSAEQAKVVAVSDAAVDELIDADTVILASGIINFNISSNLKSWIDHIARAGRTFRYTEQGPEGLVANKKVYVVLASAGTYSEGPSTVIDFAVPYLKFVLSFWGLTDVEFIRIEGTAAGEDAVKAAISKAQAQIDAIAARPAAIAA